MAEKKKGIDLPQTKGKFQVRGKVHRKTISTWKSLQKQTNLGDQQVSESNLIQALQCMLD